jgi:hypothetical protein
MAWKANTSVKIKNKYYEVWMVLIVIKHKLFRHYGHYSCQDIVSYLITRLSQFKKIVLKTEVNLNWYTYNVLSVKVKGKVVPVLN